MAARRRIPIFPRPGIYRGATPSVSAGRWFDMNGMRWRSGQLIPVGGSAALPSVLMDGPGRDGLTWHDNSGKRWGAFGTDNKLYALDFEFSLLRDITPAGVGPLEPPGAAIGYGRGDYNADAYGTARDPSNIGVSDISPLLGDMWSLDLFGEDLMIVPTQDQRLFRWSPTTPDTLPAVVPNAPAANAGVVVTDERHVVLLGSGGNSRQIAWCDQENPDVWATAVDNLAGNLLMETEGRPLNALRVPSGVLIWTDNDLHLLKYLGPPYAYGINKIAAGCGPISRRAMTQAGGVTLWIGQQSFWKYDGSVSPLASEVGDWLFSLMNRDMVGRVFGVPNAAFTEQWFYFPDGGSQECNRYVGVNYGDANTPWIIGQQSRTAGDVRGTMLRPVMCDLAGHVVLHEYGWLDDGASRVGQIYVETGDFTLTEGADNRLHVLQIEQDFVGPENAVGYRFLGWEEMNGPEFDTGIFPISNDSGLTDVRFSARGCRMRIEALADGPFALGKTRLITRAGGRR